MKRCVGRTHVLVALFPSFINLKLSFRIGLLTKNTFILIFLNNNCIYYYFIRFCTLKIYFEFMRFRFLYSNRFFMLEKPINLMIIGYKWTGKRWLIFCLKFILDWRIMIDWGQWEIFNLTNTFLIIFFLGIFGVGD